MNIVVAESKIHLTFEDLVGLIPQRVLHRETWEIGQI